MAKSTKNYLRGGAKLVTFPDGGELINLDLKLEELNSLPVNDNGYVKITLSRKPAVDQYGNAYSVFENDFVPDGKKKPSVAGPSNSRPKASNNSPFG